MPYSVSGAVAQFGWIPRGDAGTRATLSRMRRLVRDAMSDQVELPALRQTATSIISSCPVKHHVCEADTLFKWVRDHIRWCRDVHERETIQRPLRTLEWKAGDCDDKSILLASLLLAVGLGPVRFKAIAARPEAPRSFSHVYVQIMVGGQWTSLDPTVARAKMGWESPIRYREMTLQV